MAGVITKDGLASRAAYNGTDQQWLNSLTLKLFQNNWTPVETDVVAAASEATFTGYASQALNDFGAPFLNGNNHEEFDAGAHTFTQTGTGVTNTIYGYYAIDGAGKLCLAERAPASFAMDTTGKQYIVTPKFYSGQLSGTP